MTAHSDKATQTLELMNTVGADWKHPAVEWKQELVKVLDAVWCPTCRGEKKAYYTAEQAAQPYTSQDIKDDAPAAFTWPEGEVEYVYTHGASTMTSFNNSFGLKHEVRKQHAARLGVVEQGCRTCYRLAKQTWGGREHGRASVHSCGRVLALVKKLMWVGYIQWPTGTQFGTSRFANSYGESRTHCELCAKGINRSNRVPLVTIKDGQARAMWVGQDCARKFTGTMPLKPSTNPKKLDHALKDNMT